MKLSLDTPALILTYEGVTKFSSLSNFGKEGIQCLPNAFKNNIPGVDSDAAKWPIKRPNLDGPRTDYVKANVNKQTITFLQFLKIEYPLSLY